MEIKLQKVCTVLHSWDGKGHACASFGKEASVHFGASMMSLLVKGVEGSLRSFRGAAGVFTCIKQWLVVAYYCLFGK
jgi:hypothetical protein